MNAVAAFENRKDTLRAQLEESENMPQAISAATMTLEQIACDLAQDEQDDFARQRQQAVMALAKRLPLGLRASRAKAQIVLEETQEQPSRVRRGAVGAGAVMLAALAVYEAVNGKMNFALLQELGALLSDAEEDDEDEELLEDCTTEGRCWLTTTPLEPELEITWLRLFSAVSLKLFTVK